MLAAWAGKVANRVAAVRAKEVREVRRMEKSMSV
jgi:hypothetical protein